MTFSFHDLDNALRGNDVVIAGLAFQVSSFMLFLLTLATFHYRVQVCYVKPEERSELNIASLGKILTSLYSTSVLVLMRCAFRLAEYAGGNGGYIISHEVSLYMLDALLMITLLILLLVLKPGKAIQIAVERGQR